MKKFSHLFGPVLSRRLGRSLGVDLLPFKTCSLDCVYCECGRTTNLTTERQDFFAPEEILEELRAWKEEGGEADFVTLAGSGEPLLAKSLKKIIAGAKEITKLPVCLITNATLFSEADCREAALLADVVMPSLDAADEATFKKINRPASKLDFAAYLDGLKIFCDAYKGKGKLNLEIFLVPGINDNEEQIKALALIALSLHASEVQLNTAVRPPADADVTPLSREEMEKWATYFIPHATVIASYSQASKKETEGKRREISRDAVLTAIGHRTVCLDDLVKGQGFKKEEAEKVLEELVKAGLIKKVLRDGLFFYHV